MTENESDNINVEELSDALEKFNELITPAMELREEVFMSMLEKFQGEEYASQEVKFTSEESLKVDTYE